MRICYQHIILYSFSGSTWYLASCGFSSFHLDTGALFNISYRRQLVLYLVYILYLLYLVFVCEVFISLCVWMRPVAINNVVFFSLPIWFTLEVWCQPDWISFIGYLLHFPSHFDYSFCLKLLIASCTLDEVSLHLVNQVFFLT